MSHPPQSLQEQRVFAAARVLHDVGRQHGWFDNVHYNKSYAELRTSDPISFDEFNEIVEAALLAADAASTS